MNGLKVASVWTDYDWVPMSHIRIIQYYKDEFGIRAVQFSYEGSVYESYIEYVELKSPSK